MKKGFLSTIVSIKYLAGLLFLLSSCNDFIEIDQEGVFSDITYYRNQETAEELVMSCYDIYQSSWPITYAEVITVPGDYRSDDAHQGGDPNPRADIEGRREEIAQMQIFDNNPIVHNIWTFYFGAVWRNNVAIEKIGKIADSEFDKGIKEQFLAEARFLRAYNYSFLVKIFGDVPIIDHPLSPDEYNKSRDPKEVVFDFIIDDLRYAITHLPLKNGIDAGRATRGAAMYLLTNVLVFEAGTDKTSPNWQMAYNVADSLINGPYAGEYRLLENYRQVWMEGFDFNDETIFEIVNNDNVQTEQTSYVCYLYPRYVTNEAGERVGSWGWGNCVPTQDLVDAFETNEDYGDAVEWEDPRLQISVWRKGDIVPLGTGDPQNVNDSLPVWVEDTPDGYYTKKYWLNHEPAGFESPINQKVFRFSDLILFYAEAAWYLDKETEARNALNLIRERARQGNPDNVLPDITSSGEDLLEAIWHERRVELCMEHHRFYDLVRQGRVGQVMRAFGVNFVDGKHEVLPIPSTELDLNPSLKQNPNY
ncbi:MAG: RagB/SusD family nutrient uptake outer membrane protein [Bacteroidales bacterium]